MSEEFGRFIRSRRLDVGLSLREVARRIGVDPSHLHRVEAGKVSLAEERCRDLARVLGVESDELVFKSGRVPSDVVELFLRFPEWWAGVIRRGV